MFDMVRFVLNKTQLAKKTNIVYNITKVSDMVTVRRSYVQTIIGNR